MKELNGFGERILMQLNIISYSERRGSADNKVLGISDPTS
jgi:hypothetical protein